MAKYIVNQKCFIPPYVRDEGAEIEVPDDFVPGYHLDPVDAPAKAAWEKYDASRKKRGTHGQASPVDSLPVLMSDGPVVEPQKGKSL